ncbi:MAG TPA: sulfotransferase [Candidatus Binatia bacterium]|nr:sulfotransferase [Candidatus Binatia bacterium]
MAICITGMHRSGTSMVARLLNLCGLWLGEDGDILGPAADNPEGFWEHLGVLALDDDLLAALGGGWDVPPVTLPSEWTGRPDLAPLLARGAAIVEGFRGHGPWGWKDPRSALLLSFWQTLAPDLRVVVCVRSPLAVAGSLRTRATASTAFSLGLWRAHYERLLDAVPPEQVLLTHYDAYFHDPTTELRRVCAFAGLAPSDETLAAAVASIAPRLRHHEPGTVRTLDTLPSELADLYQRLCAATGPVHAAARARESVGVTTAAADESPVTTALRERTTHLEDTIAAREARIDTLEAATARDADEIARLTAAVAERDDVLGERDLALAATRGELAGARQAIAAGAAALEEQTRQTAQVERTTDVLRTQLAHTTADRDAITSSRAFRFIDLVWRLRLRLAPRGSRRERLLQLRA